MPRSSGAVFSHALTGRGVGDRGRCSGGRGLFKGRSPPRTGPESDGWKEDRADIPDVTGHRDTSSGESSSSSLARLAGFAELVEGCSLQLPGPDDPSAAPPEEARLFLVPVTLPMLAAGELGA